MKIWNIHIFDWFYDIIRESEITNDRNMRLTWLIIIIKILSKLR